MSDFADFFYSFVKVLLNFSKDTPLVSGIIKITNNNWKTIAIVKIKKTVPAPMVENKVGINDGITAAKTQWVELPNACPDARRWFGKISEMKTQITVPCPMA